MYSVRSLWIKLADLDPYNRQTIIMYIIYNNIVYILKLYIKCKIESDVKINIGGFLVFLFFERNLTDL